MSRPSILLLESVSNEAHQILEKDCNLLISPTPNQGLEIAEQHEINGIITRGKGQVNEQLIDACRGLQAIGRCGVGLDNVNIDAATKLGVKVINAPGSNADTVAEHTLGLILSLQRNLYRSIKEVKAGNWNFRTQYSGDEIRGKTLGVIGMGDIGSKVARLASAFGMDIIYWNRSDINSPYTSTSLREVLNTSDIITIHLSLNDETRGLLNANSFSNNTKKPILINTSRGGIIDDDEILEALRKGYLSGFGGDVLSTEPPVINYPLVQMDNVEITPHSASLTALTFNEMCVLTVNNVLDVIQGKSIDTKYIYNIQEM
jgi:lactate dehydrogenase-like 2-hydroxyacid dehydrogenase